jgi:hypothetical protein
MTGATESLVLTHIVVLALYKALCLLLGFLIVRMGRGLLTSGVKGEFKFSGSFVGMKSDLVSASPGLLFLVLGVALMIHGISETKTGSVDFAAPTTATPPPEVGLPVPASETQREGGR